MARCLTRGVVLFLLLAAPAAAEEVKTYRTAVFGFEFDYPASYVLKETAAPDGVPIFLLLREAAAGPRDWTVEVSPTRLRPDDRTLYGAEATATPRAFARHRATLVREVHEEAVEDEDRTETTERTRGPIYAFDISAGPASRIVIFTPASRGWDSPGALRVLEEMARSLRRTGAPGVK